MKRTALIILVNTISFLVLTGQVQDSVITPYLNTAETLLKSNSKLGIGGYGEVHYNQPLSKDQKELGTLDVHRMVMFLGYNFSGKTQFVSETEVEYAREIWIEQAFLQHKINSYINFRAGLLLVPMGIINEYHEPVTFNGVERPVTDNRLGLSTWREAGAGIAGTILPTSLKYQLYAVSGLNGYDTKAIFNGTNGLREGRQKGSKAYVSSPAFTGKIEYFGIRNLNIGLSAYAGRSQSRLYGKLPDDNNTLKAKADSSSVGIAMIGADTRFEYEGLVLRGQLYYVSISNTTEYNRFTRIAGVNNDLGKSMTGYYAEAGYDVFKLFNNIDKQLIPFIRYEFYNTHNTVSGSLESNPAYKNTLITTGLTLKLNEKAVLKTDMQFSGSAATEKYNKTFSAGIGVMF
ncbi:MAG TPA: hypothetical protein PL123_00435 [Bacteroidales bacterium]|nr:hypothetical protein [Bacteroidales bacterium]